MPSVFLKQMDQTNPAWFFFPSIMCPSWDTTCKICIFFLKIAKFPFDSYASVLPLGIRVTFCARCSDRIQIDSYNATPYKWLPGLCRATDFGVFCLNKSVLHSDSKLRLIRISWKDTLLYLSSPFAVHKTVAVLTKLPAADTRLETWAYVVLIFIFTKVFFKN